MTTNTATMTDRALGRRLSSRLGDFFGSDDGIPVVVVGGVAVLWIVRFSSLVIVSHNRYGSADFDMGIFDQASWLVAHGSQFDTVRGLPLFGHHATFGFYFFAPLYWLGFDGPTVLNVAQVLVLGAIPLIVYWVAREVGLEPWVACVAAFVSIMHFSTSWLTQELFHPEVFAIAPMLAAYGFAVRDKRRPYWLMLVLAVVWKEDVALAIAGLGVVFLFDKTRRRLGVQTIAFGVVWFLVATQIVLPHFSPTGEAFYAEGFYGDLGNTVTDVAKTSVLHPSRTNQHLSNADAFGYVRDLWAPFGYVNLAAPATLLVGLPQLFANLLSVNDFTWSLRFHYVALPLLASILGLVLGLARLRGSWRAFAAGIALAASIATALSWGVGPYTKNYRAGYWPLAPNSDQRELDHAVSLIPSRASVSASYHLVSHLSSRELIFSFPNPWKPNNWGIDDRNQRDPRSVEWLVVMTADLSPEDRALLDEILSDTTAISIVYRTPAVVVARRMHSRAR
jgi:uncharacterized membrane protein